MTLSDIMKISNKVYILVFILILATVFMLLVLKNKEIYQVCFERNCFSVELAKTAQQQEQGLMFRESLESNQGMLFIFESLGNYPFWMKNTLIPLDIIWINSNQEIVFISRNTSICKEEPCQSINPNKEAKYVLEINAGISEEINLNIGDKLELK